MWVLVEQGHYLSSRCLIFSTLISIYTCIDPQALLSECEVDGFNVVSQRIKNKCSIIALGVLCSQPWLSIVRSTSFTIPKILA